MDDEESDALAMTRDELVARFEAAREAQRKRDAMSRLMRAMERAHTGGRVLLGSEPRPVVYDRPAKLEAVGS